MQIQCPIETPQINKRIELSHGSGGRGMNRLLDVIRNQYLQLSDGETAPHDSAVVFDGIAFTTDSYVVSPLFFPGGNIGDLAVNGTINDLAMSGAMPHYLSLSLIIEEGFLQDDLAKILTRIGDLAKQYQIKIVTGDTKVVGRGQADGLFINTSGLGRIATSYPISPKQIRPGDSIIISGDIGRHAIAIALARNELGFETEVESDTQAVHLTVQGLIAADIGIHCMRDLTRGGLGSCLHELSRAAGCRMVIENSAIPVNRNVRAVSEVLGMDPIFMANEGCFVCFVAADQSEAAVEIIRASGHPLARIIGLVEERAQTHVEIVSEWGTRRILAWPESDPLPRIC
jgi:hydrogenase expression/formation protein HypE